MLAFLLTFLLTYTQVAAGKAVALERQVGELGAAAEGALSVVAAAPGHLFSVTRSYGTVGMRRSGLHIFNRAAVPLVSTI